MYSFDEVLNYDPEVAKAMEDELTRQRTHIELIASENLVSKAVMAAMGLGRCQGGFCSPKIMEILSRELNINILDITKSEKGSEIIKGFDKESL